MGRRIDLVGRSFGKLRVVEWSHKDHRRVSHWRCQCSCGQQLIVAGNNLTSGNSTSCGCRHGISVSDPITQEELKKFVSYDPATGYFTWLCSGRNFEAGTRAGHYNDVYGYVRMSIAGQMYYGHVLVWLYMTGRWPAEEIDHEDTDTLNNKWDNLRCASHAGNCANKFVQTRNVVGYKGVQRSRNRFVARITENGVARHIGSYIDPESAARAYDKAARLAFGKFARTNFEDV